MLFSIFSGYGLKPAIMPSFKVQGKCIYNNMNSNGLQVIREALLMKSAGIAIVFFINFPPAFDLLNSGTLNAQLSHFSVPSYFSFRKFTVFLYKHANGKKKQRNANDQDCGYEQLDEHICYVFNKNNKL